MKIYNSPNDNSIWAFAAPASLVLCINLVLMITICYIISKLEYQGTRLLHFQNVSNMMMTTSFQHLCSQTTGLGNYDTKTLAFGMSSNSIKGANDKEKTLQRVKSTMKSIIFLFPLTGTCWLFGIMSLQKEMHLAYQYLFTITNSFQEIFDLSLT